MPSAEKCDGNSGTIDCRDVQLARDRRRRAAGRRRRRRPARNRADRSPSRPIPRARRATFWRSRSRRSPARPRSASSFSGVGDASRRCRARAPSASSVISPPRKLSRIEPAEHDVGVGDGRLGAAAAVADRAGIGAGALRPDLERADLVDPGDAAAAGADLDHVDHRQHHRMAAGVAADVIARRHRRLAVADQARLGGGAAHVERDHVGEAERLADARRRR